MSADLWTVLLGQLLGLPPPPPPSLPGRRITAPDPPGDSFAAAFNEAFPGRAAPTARGPRPRGRPRKPPKD